VDEARRSEPAPAKAGVLGDKDIVAAIYEALAKRHPQSRTRGRPGTPAEVVLRLLVLKHMRNWSYGVLEREVRANLVYRDFTRAKEALVPQRPEMADRLRGSHQRGQTTAWTGSQPVQGGYRNQALGRPRGDCRQLGQHQPRHGQAAQPIIPIPIPLHNLSAATCRRVRAPSFVTRSSENGFLRRKVASPDFSYRVGFRAAMTCATAEPVKRMVVVGCSDRVSTFASPCGSNGP
jgi:hypothetical protein